MGQSRNRITNKLGRSLKGGFAVERTSYIVHTLAQTKSLLVEQARCTRSVKIQCFPDMHCRSHTLTPRY